MWYIISWTWIWLKGSSWDLFQQINQQNKWLKTNKMFIYLEIVRTDLWKPIVIWYGFKGLIYRNSKNGKQKKMWEERCKYSPRSMHRIMKCVWYIAKSKYQRVDLGVCETQILSLGRELKCISKKCWVKNPISKNKSRANYPKTQT